MFVKFYIEDNNIQTIFLEFDYLNSNIKKHDNSFANKNKI